MKMTSTNPPIKEKDKAKYGGVTNPAHKLRHAKDRPVSKHLEEQSVKFTSEEIAKAMEGFTGCITYVSPQRVKTKQPAKAKQKATPKTHYSKLVKKLSFNKVK